MATSFPEAELLGCKAQSHENTLGRTKHIVGQQNNRQKNTTVSVFKNSKNFWNLIWRMAQVLRAHHLDQKQLLESTTMLDPKRHLMDASFNFSSRWMRWQLSHVQPFTKQHANPTTPTSTKQCYYTRLVHGASLQLCHPFSTTITNPSDIHGPYWTFIFFAIRLQLQQIRHISQHREADHWNTSKADTWKASAKWMLGTSADSHGLKFKNDINKNMTRVQIFCPLLRWCSCLPGQWPLSRSPRLRDWLQGRLPTRQQPSVLLVQGFT